MATWKKLKDESASEVTSVNEKILFKLQSNEEEETAKYARAILYAISKHHIIRSY